MVRDEMLPLGAGTHSGIWFRGFDYQDPGAGPIQVQAFQDFSFGAPSTSILRKWIVGAAQSSRIFAKGSTGTTMLRACQPAV